MPYYVAIMETINPEKDAEILESHKAYLSAQIELGKIIAKGPFTDHSGGLIIFKTESYEEAKTIMDQDPVVVHNSRSITLKEWRSSLAF